MNATDFMIPFTKGKRPFEKEGLIYTVLVALQKKPGQ